MENRERKRAVLAGGGGAQERKRGTESRRVVTQTRPADFRGARGVRISRWKLWRQTRSFFLSSNVHLDSAVLASSKRLELNVHVQLEKEALLTAYRNAVLSPPLWLTLLVSCCT